MLYAGTPLRPGEYLQPVIPLDQCQGPEAQALDLALQIDNHVIIED